MIVETFYFPEVVGIRAPLRTNFSGIGYMSVCLCSLPILMCVQDGEDYMEMTVELLRTMGSVTVYMT